MGKEKDQGTGPAEEKFMSKLPFVDDEAGMGNSTSSNWRLAGKQTGNVSRASCFFPGL